MKEQIWTETGKYLSRKWKPSVLPVKQREPLAEMREGEDQEVGAQAVEAVVRVEVDPEEAEEMVAAPVGTAVEIPVSRLSAAE